MAEIKLDYGLNIATTAPVDKRIVVDKLSDLYNSANAQFTYVYKGLTVTVVNTLETESDGVYSYTTGGASTWVLIDTAPYEFGTTIVLSRDNYTTYWQRVAGASADDVATEGKLYWDDLDLD